MNTKNKSLENFDELVFENKNKTYGAYAIRKSYNDNVTKSLIVTLTFFGGFAFLSFWLTNNHEKLPSVIVENITPLLPGIEVIIDPPKPPELKPIDPRATPPKTESGVLAASDDKDKTVEKTTDEKDFSKNPNPEGSDSTAAKATDFIPYVKEVLPSKPTTYADVMPEFNGILSKYLKDNLRYPRNAVEIGTSGTVVLQFIVEEDGSIGNITVLNSVPDGCTDEAIRVVKGMPKWKPGKNLGEPVRVIFNLPVKFRLQ